MKWTHSVSLNENKKKFQIFRGKILYERTNFRLIYDIWSYIIYLTQRKGMLYTDTKATSTDDSAFMICVLFYTIRTFTA